ncbi:trypsin-like serine protease [Gordonia sp. CPCC 205333]|uniref:trypsin-like serine protease n=1 Tax=Gordonia sp. CPCC 205333 TaxID=3140790 RepID=UPI003AF3D510
MRAKYVASAILATAIAVTTPTAVAQAAPTTPVRSGMEINLPETPFTAAKCTLGVVISPSRAYTAGHCGDVGKAVYNTKGKRIGRITANLGNTRHLDIAVITLARGTSARVDAVDWSGRFAKGQPVTKFGVTTGRGRGVITNPKAKLRGAHGFSLAPPFLKLQDTFSISASLRAAPGDSGGPIRNSSGAVIGIMSTSNGNSASTFAPVSRVPGYLR